MFPMTPAASWLLICVLMLTVVAVIALTALIDSRPQHKQSQMRQTERPGLRLIEVRPTLRVAPVCSRKRDFPRPAPGEVYDHTIHGL